MSDLSDVLAGLQRGDIHASEELLPLVYDELRKLASQRLVREKPGQTLQATALVHEAYLRLVRGWTEPQTWDSKGHFFAAAAEAMRRILVDNARRKAALKRGGGQPEQELLEVAAPASEGDIDLEALDEALRQLESEHPDKVQIVKLKFFAGFTLEEAAECLGISRATAQRHWNFARAWLYGRMTRDS